MTDDRDPILDTLLALDGYVFVRDAGHSVKFVVKQVPVSAARPHGLSYSLTLHDENGARLVGFDNAHAPPKKKGQARRVKHDHRHRLRTVLPYDYQDAAKLLTDFWDVVEAVLKERGAS